MTAKIICVVWGCIFLLCSCGDGHSDTENERLFSLSLGADQIVNSSVLVTIASRVSGDNAGSLEYQWAQVSGDAVSFQSEYEGQIQFYAPQVIVSGQYRFELQVNDADGAMVTDTILITVKAAAVPAVSHSLSGRITKQQSFQVDSDVNDPGMPFTANDTILTAQSLSEMANVAGYVNKANTGEAGRSRASGDAVDFYRLNISAPVTVVLQTTDHLQADIDLYLYDAGGELLNASTETSALESLQLDVAGIYFVAVAVFKGASSYQLQVSDIPAANFASSLRLSNDFVNGEALSSYKSGVSASSKASSSNSAQEAIRRSGFAIRDSGGNGSLRLVLMDGSPVDDVNKPSTQRKGRSKELPQTIAEMMTASGTYISSKMSGKLQTLLAIKKLRALESLAYVEPNFMRRPLLTPSDPYYSQQWNYPAIQLPAAWDLTTGDAAIVVAVLDTGIVRQHEEMQGRIIDEYEFIAEVANAGDGDGLDANADDPGGDVLYSRFHGTQVAGIIAANANNGVGGSGIAWGVKLMPLRVLGVQGGGTTYDINQAMLYAAGLENASGQIASPAADIINLSLGGAGYSQVDQDTINKVRDAGVIIVAAAGNAASTEAYYPAGYDGVIAVSALDAVDEITVYSNTGPAIDIAAPGGDTGVDKNGDGYADGIVTASAIIEAGGIVPVMESQQGTSMSAPHVAAVIALMKSVYPSLAPAELDILMLQGGMSDDIGESGRDSLYGMGRLNAYKAVNSALLAKEQQPGDQPWLVAVPAQLQFSYETSLLLQLANIGAGELVIEQMNSGAPWLHITAQGIDAQGLGSYRIIIERNALPEGKSEAEISIVSNLNTVTILVSVYQSTPGTEALNGHVLLLDAITHLPLFQTKIKSDKQGVSGYRFDSVVPGDYWLLAGSDLDNDYRLCEQAESCGFYGSVVAPVTISLQKSRADVDIDVRLMDAAFIPAWQPVRAP